MASDRSCAQLGHVGMAAGEMEQRRAGLGRRRTTDADLHAVGQHIQASVAPVQHADDIDSVEDRRKQARRIGGGGDELDIADGFLAAAQRPGRLGPDDARVTLEQRQDRLDEHGGASESQARGGTLQARKRGGDSRCRPGVETADLAQRLLLQLGDEVGRGGGAGRRVQSSQLIDRDRARLEQPAQIGREIGNRRFAQHPGARVEHLIEASVESGVGDGGRLQERSELVVGANAGGLNQFGGATEKLDFSRVSANRSESREVVNRAEERRRGVASWRSRKSPVKTSRRQVPEAPVSEPP